MRPLHKLVHSRARVRQRYALFPLEGYPFSRLPNWVNTDARVLASPALGAAFAQFLMTMQPGGTGRYESDHRVETFFYVLSGSADVNVWTPETSSTQRLTAGGFAYVPANYSCRIKASTASEVLMLRKVFEPETQGGPGPISNHESNIERVMYMGDKGARLQTLIPDDLKYDMAMNIFTFDPGHGLPYVETHVMEHGLLVLEGKGLYYLDGEWMEVEKDDFIWMGPYCPQSFYATGPTPARYLYYKNVNREIPL